MPEPPTHPPAPAPPGGPHAPPKASGPHPGRPVIGGYEIEGELGRGGMGVVYLARQKRLNRRVALKMLSGHYGPDELQRFLAEAETAAGLHHTNIAQIYEVGEHDGAPFYAMEHAEGGSLADLLRKDLPLPRDAVELLVRVTRALHFAHQNGIVHRDMKPANVLLDPEGVPKIADFGIAKRLKEKTRLTLSGAVVGTPTYMAPEQAKGTSRHVGPAADVYSLGAILYEMLTGRPPFLPEESETAMTVRVLTEDPVSPAFHRPGVPRDLEVICMKCLEKEPRDRYASAAALAEDFRRFLEDETIVARPPTTAVRTMKWVRRHPWKFVGSGALVLLAVAGVVGLTWWELYRHPRLEYAAQVEWVHGGLEPVAKLSKAKASYCATYLRLTRRGRLGPVVKVEVLNARGHPAVLRRLLNNEMISIYIEGLAGAQPYTEKKAETTVVEFSFDQRAVQEATGRDRTGSVNWRLLYDRSASSVASARARFVNLQGFDASSRDGASHMEFERDARGRDVKIAFFNANGQPAANGEGVYGYKLERDDAGRIASLLNLGRDGQPAANRLGLTAFSLNWGKERRLEVRDAKMQPALWNGISTFVTETDQAGNATRTSNLAADGLPVLVTTAMDWSVQEMKRNERGELTQRTFFKTDTNRALEQISQLNIRYDEFGHPADLQFAGVTPWRLALRHDANGNVMEETFLDAKGEPMTGERGYASKRFAYLPGPKGMRIEQTYFDPAGKKTYNTGGYHRLIDESDSTGALHRQTMDEHDPARFKYYRYVSELESDPQGRMRHTISRFEDAQGQLATTADLFFTANETFYDENGRVTTEWRLGADVETFGGPIVRTDSEWHSTGTTKRRVRQVCDEKRQPLPFISNGEAARYEEEFDAIAQLQRIYETGFDETLVGFSSRETKFEGSALRSVTHQRSDGTALDSVRVIIKWVTPAQAKAAELRAGDQLVAANDQPVTSAYAWVFRGFPGGWIEVLREGKRVRIEGFEPGPVGIELQDRR